MKKLFSVLFVLVVSLSLFAGGCSNNDTENKPIRPYNTDSLSIYYYDPTTLDPALVSDIVSASYVIQIFSGLVTIDGEGQVVGDMAHSWDITEDGLLYTFHLRPDIYFHDGRLLTSYDIVFSWVRALHPTTGSHMAYTYLGNIVGADEVSAGSANDLDGVNVIDSLTLQVRIKEASSYFLAGLTYPCAFVVSAKQMQEEGVNWILKPIGTGPYMVMENYYGHHISLQNFDGFYGQKASIKNVEFITQPNKRAVEMFASGEVGITYFSSLYFDMVMDSYGTLRHEVMEFDRLQTTYLAFGVNKAPFDDYLVRQAFSMAIDINKLAETVYRGCGESASGFVPYGIFGYDGALSPYSFNPQAALNLIAQSSYGSVANLPTIYLTVAGRGPSVDTALLAIADQWQTNLGVEIEILVLESTDFYNADDSSNANVFYFQWLADYAHPQNFLDILLSSYGAVNVGGYNSTEYDDLIYMANTATDLASSFALYKQAETLALTDAVVVPLLFGNSLLLVDKNLDGFEISLFDLPILNAVSYREVPL